MAEPNAISEQGVEKLNAAYGEGGWTLEKDRGGTWRVVKKSAQGGSATPEPSLQEQTSSKAD